MYEECSIWLRAGEAQRTCERTNTCKQKLAPVCVPAHAQAPSRRLHVKCAATTCSTLGACTFSSLTPASHST